MDALCHGDVPLGIVPWDASGRVFTLIVKVSYDLHGPVSPIASTREPLGLDRLGARGSLVYPSDFAPYKHHCDVVLVGEDATRTDGQGTLAMGALDKRIVPGSSLGPLPTLGERGNPEDPRLGRSWTASGFDYERLQTAPRDQRMTWPTFPLSMAYVRGGERVVTTLPSAGAQAMLLDGRGVAPPSEIALRADLVALEPSRGLCHVTLRGVYVARVVHPTAPIIAVALGGVLFTYGAHDLARWPRVRPIRPSDLAASLQPHVSASGPTRASFERTMPLGATSPLAPPSTPPSEPWADEVTQGADAAPGHAPGDPYGSLGRSPHAPELVRPRSTGELVFDDPTTTTISVRPTLDAVTFVDGSPDSEVTRPTVVARPTTTGASPAHATVDRRILEGSEASLESVLGHQSHAAAFSVERRRMARALGRRYATDAALREVAASVPALREAVDITTWGEV